MNSLVTYLLGSVSQRARLRQNLIPIDSSFQEISLTTGLFLELNVGFCIADLKITFNVKVAIETRLS